VQCYGPEASAFTKQLLPEGTAVRIVRDVEARDDYGRLLGYVYRADDGLFVNLEIVAQGYAALLTFPPNVAHVDEFVAAARAAERENLGLWSACSG
jgi:micrococcal nuclease